MTRIYEIPEISMFIDLDKLLSIEIPGLWIGTGEAGFLIRMVGDKEPQKVVVARCIGVPIYTENEIAKIAAGARARLIKAWKQVNTLGLTKCFDSAPIEDFDKWFDDYCAKEKITIHDSSRLRMRAAWIAGAQLVKVSIPYGLAEQTLRDIRGDRE